MLTHHKCDCEQLSFLINVLNGTFTVLKNSGFHPVLRDQINCAAIVAP